MNALQSLIEWYSDQCNGDWEHTYGVKIDTLDNPGWSLEVNLTETDLEDRAFEPYQIQRTEEDWIVCRAETSPRGRVFVGYGGAGNLEELLLAFLTWSKESSQDEAG